MSTNGGSSNSKGECKECVRMYRNGHNDARKPKFCPRHQCSCTDATGIMCTKRKRADDIHCTIHTQCKVVECRAARAGVLNEYCASHTCIVESCDDGKAHDPVRCIYNDLCSNHMAKSCKIPTCVDWRFEHGGNFCLRHTCDICNEKSLFETGRPFCVEHNKCINEGCQKPRTQFGSRFEAVCGEHYLPPCRQESCTSKSSPSTRYCDLHACRYTGQIRCTKEARPGRGKPFCADHKCSDVDCQFLRTFSEIEGALRMNAFCLDHECKDKTCVKHTIQGKPFCNSHCCTDQGCINARDGNPRIGTLCFIHYEKKIAAKAKTEQLDELRRRQEEQAAADRAEAARRQRAEEEAATIRAERARRAREEEQQAEARRQAARREEDRRREQQAFDEARQANLPRRPARSPPRRQYGDTLRPDRRSRLDDPYDEGYRSNRSSGDSFGGYEGR